MKYSNLKLGEFYYLVRGDSNGIQKVRIYDVTRGAGGKDSCRIIGTYQILYEKEDRLFVTARAAANHIINKLAEQVVELERDNE